VPVSVEALDGNLNPLGPISYIKTEFTPRYNQVGSWTLTLPATDKNWELAATTDLCISSNWNGVWSGFGFLETWNPSRTIDNTTGLVTDTITLSGADGLGLIANRMAYPKPTSAWPSQLTTSTDVQTTVALETAIKHFCNVNAGPGAITTRRAPHLTIATDAARGATVSYTVQLSAGTDLPLMDLFRTLIATAGPLGLSVTLESGALVFDCYVPVDRSKTAYFSYGLGNLRTHNLSITNPTCTNALVRGASTFIEVTDGSADGWTRTELLVDQSSSTDATAMTTAGDDAIVQGAGAATLAVEAIDLPRLRFGRDFNLGDVVSAEIRPGAVYADIVSQVALVADATSGQAYAETVTTTIGASGSDIGDNATATARLAARIRALERELKRLQAG
jgi:hypothetical protein